LVSLAIDLIIHEINIKMSIQGQDNWFKRNRAKMPHVSSLFLAI